MIKQGILQTRPRLPLLLQVLDADARIFLFKSFLTPGEALRRTSRPSYDGAATDASSSCLRQPQQQQQWQQLLST